MIQLKERLTDYERKRKHKEGLYLIYSEKDYFCYSFKYDDKGFLVEDKDYDLKKLRLAISDKPVSLNPKESSSPQSSDLKIHDDKLFVNELFFSLLHRGEIDFYKLYHLPFSEDDTAKKNSCFKKSGLASTGKPSAAERIQQGIPSTIDNIYDNKIIINNLTKRPSENGR